MSTKDGVRTMDRVRRLRQSRWWVLFIRPLLFLAVSLLVARLLISLVGSVDWQQVLTALGRLSWAQVPPLLALLLARQAFNAVPLAVFVPGLGFWRVLQNDLTANLVGTVAPPPATSSGRTASSSAMNASAQRSPALSPTSSGGSMRIRRVRLPLSADSRMGSGVEAGARCRGARGGGVACCLSRGRGAAR